MGAVEDGAVNDDAAADPRADGENHAHARALECAHRVFAHRAGLAVVTHRDGDAELLTQDAADGAFVHIGERSAVVDGAVGVVLEDEARSAHAYCRECSGMRLRDVADCPDDLLA